MQVVKQLTSVRIIGLVVGITALVLGFSMATTATSTTLASAKVFSFRRSRFGKQAKEAVEKYIDEIIAIGKLILFVPHPAARNLTNVRCEEIRNKIKEYKSKD